MYCLDNIDNIKNTVRPKKTAHVYVPYNCGRKCPFCESRKMYDSVETCRNGIIAFIPRPFLAEAERSQPKKEYGKGKPQKHQKGLSKQCAQEKGQGPA